MRPLADPRARRRRRGHRVVFLAGAAAALIVVAVVAVLVHHESGQGGGAPVLTTPSTISPGKSTSAQCPAGAYDGHCIVVPPGITTTTIGS